MSGHFATRENICSETMFDPRAEHEKGFVNQRDTREQESMQRQDAEDCLTCHTSGPLCSAFVGWLKGKSEGGKAGERDGK